MLKKENLLYQISLKIMEVDKSIEYEMCSIFYKEEKL